MSTPEELHDYIGLSDTSSDKLLSSSIDNKVLNFKETELRLGLPGLGLCVKNIASSSGAKRVFSDAYTNWVVGSDVDGVLGINNVGENKTSPVSGHATAPAPKAQVVGWPPIRSFRKNTIATNLTKKTDVVEASSSSGCLYIKVSMDGAPYLRKVDLRTYCNYTQLSSALEKMFSCFTIGQCTSNGLPERGLSASNLKDLVSGSEYVLTYEDKDGDWMLVGDVPWDMFTDTCKRLRIMKGSEATGLAPRVTEKCKNHGY